jgi:inner membrane transporter RhtA
LTCLDSPPGALVTDRTGRDRSCCQSLPLISSASAVPEPNVNEPTAVVTRAEARSPGNRRHSQAVGALLLIVSCLAVQGSAAASTSLFAQMGAPAVAAWRQLMGAVVLVVLLRPRLRGRERRRWILIGALGVCIAAMNTTFYLTVERLPLGIAASVLHLGPFTVAAATIRRGPRLAWPVLALIGVLAITRPDHLANASAAGFALAGGNPLCA